MALKYGIGMGRKESITDIGREIKLAEALGYDHITFIDSQSLARDSVAMMTLAASITRRVQIGHGVTQPYTRHPAVLANSVATVDELSGGRAFLGIAAGGSALGVMGKKPRSMEELASITQFFRDFTSGREATWHDQQMHSEWIRRKIPVILGVDGPKSCKIAGALADGAFMPGFRPEILKWRRKIIGQAATDAERSIEDLELWTRTMAFVHDDVEFARSQVRSYACTCAYQFYYGTLRWKTPEAEEIRAALPGTLVAEIEDLGQRYDWYQHELKDAQHSAAASPELIDSYVICGPPSKCIDQIASMREAGMDHISMTTYTIQDKAYAMRRFVEDVYPYVA